MVKDDIFHWKGLINGPVNNFYFIIFLIKFYLNFLFYKKSDTPYEGGLF